MLQCPFFLVRYCQVTVGVGMPEAVAWKAAFLPAVTVEVARKLDVPNMVLVVNKVPQAFNMEEVKARVEKTYNATVAAVLPHSEEMMTLASAGIFTLRYPDHIITKQYQALADILMR